MNGVVAFLLSALFLGLGGMPAHAHPGDHSQFSFADLASHLFEVDHLVFLTLIVIVGVLAYRAGRRSAQDRGGR